MASEATNVESGILTIGLQQQDKEMQFSQEAFQSQEIHETGLCPALGTYQDLRVGVLVELESCNHQKHEYMHQPKKQKTYHDSLHRLRTSHQEILLEMDTQILFADCCGTSSNTSLLCIS